jgi:hypothetical protein
VRGAGDESAVGAARGATVGVWATAASFAPATLSEHSGSNDNIRTWSRAAAHGGRRACCR